VLRLYDGPIYGEPSAPQFDMVDASALLRPVRNRAARIGGSHAQGDLIDLTLIEAARRDGQGALVEALEAERAFAKPEGCEAVGWRRAA
jgi:hypothetical protein